jgi:peptide/nickel transport system permease protein
MLQFIIRRIIYVIPTLILISIVSYGIIELPPGDFLTSYVAQLEQRGEKIDQSELVALKQRYGLGQPVYVRYWKWITKVMHGDFGVSFEWNKPVSELIFDRLGLTALIAILSTLFIWAVALPIGIYSATHQYSLGDYLVTVIGFAGLAVPSFVLALILMVFFYTNFGVSVGGLFSPDMELAPWNLAKVGDLLAHLPVPLVVIGLAGTASIIRIMRATLLDELNKPYVETARAKGLAEGKLLFKYPVRIALNPIASTAGWLLPAMFSGSTIVAIVLNLPTIGPLLYQALMTEDMFLAGGTVLISTVLTVIGTFVSDVLLIWLDPRIRFEQGA